MRGKVPDADIKGDNYLDKHQGNKGSGVSGKTEIILYRTSNGEIRIDTVFRDETIWLTQAKMAELFGVNVPAISKHLNNIFEEGELQKKATVSKMETVQQEGNRQVSRNRDFYNLDALIAVGYRVNSKRATQFRIWATNILKEDEIKDLNEIVTMYLDYAERQARKRQTVTMEQWEEKLDAFLEFNEQEILTHA